MTPSDRIKRGTSLVALLAYVASACVLVAYPDTLGDHCSPSPRTTDCMSCLLAKCQSDLDACCAPTSCSALVTQLSNCGERHDASCTEASALRSSNDQATARLASCASAVCGAVCAERSGISTTECKVSRLGENSCSCAANGPTNDINCSETSQPGAVCCASPAWPGQALRCACEPIVCVPSGTGCFCSPNQYAEPGYQTTCGGAGLTCCAFNGTCKCGTQACAAPEVQVERCAADVIGCDRASMRVSSCSIRTQR
jgi:hypothetical protein